MRWRAAGSDRCRSSGIEDLIGGGAKMMLKRVTDSRGGLPDDEFRVLYKALLAFYADNNCVHTRPIRARMKRSIGSPNRVFGWRW